MPNRPHNSLNRQAANTVRYSLRDGRIERLSLEADDVLYIGDEIPDQPVDDVLYIEDDEAEETSEDA